MPDRTVPLDSRDIRRRLGPLLVDAVGVADEVGAFLTALFVLSLESTRPQLTETGFDDGDDFSLKKADTQTINCQTRDELNIGHSVAQCILQRICCRCCRGCRRRNTNVARVADERLHEDATTGMDGSSLMSVQMNWRKFVVHLFANVLQLAVVVDANCRRFNSPKRNRCCCCCCCCRCNDVTEATPPSCDKANDTTPTKPTETRQACRSCRAMTVPFI